MLATGVLVAPSHSLQVELAVVLATGVLVALSHSLQEVLLAEVAMTGVGYPGFR